MNKLAHSLAVAALVPLGLASTGCLSAILADGQIAATREASDAFNVIADYELARSAAQAGLVQFEGMHRLRPNNTDGLYLLTQAWVGYGFAFPQDDYEDAVDRNDDDAAEYHKKRAGLAYDRAAFFGLELLSHNDKGFDAAKRNDETMKKWLNANFSSRDDAANLFWTGYAWLSRVDLSKENPELVADLWIGVDMIERSVAIDPTVEHYSGTVALAAYHSRPAGEPEQSKQMFELALAKTERKELVVQFTYAVSYACAKGDRGLYEQLLNEVLAAQDPDPNQRLTNMIAKRRAKRFLGKSRMMECGFDMSSKTPAKPAAAAAPAPAPAPPPAPAVPAPAAAPLTAPPAAAPAKPAKPAGKP
jgi:TRAP transporter T-component